MDDKLILKILSSVSTDSWFVAEEESVDGINCDMLFELHQSGLLHYEWRNMPANKRGYRRTPAGTDWIRNYNNQQRTEEHQNRIEALEIQNSKRLFLQIVLAVLAVFFAAIAAIPGFQHLNKWIQQIRQGKT